jgi:uncharacterized RmlC-like cupin family protein
MSTVRVIRAGEMPAAASTTPGMDRHEAFVEEGVWTGTVRTEPGVLTGWHMHADYDTYIYVVSGEARVEFGPGGQRGEDARPGDFILIPRGAVHREGTSAGSNGVDAVLVRIGHGELVTNVDGPDSA